MLPLRDTITVVDEMVLNRGSTSERITLADRLAVTDDGVFEHGVDRLRRCLVRSSRKLDGFRLPPNESVFTHAAMQRLCCVKTAMINMIGDIHVR